MTVKFRFFGDIEKMIGRMNIVARIYFSMMWFVGSPIMILFIGQFRLFRNVTVKLNHNVLVINAFIGYKPLADRYFETYGDDAYIIYPAWSNGLGMYIGLFIRDPQTGTVNTFSANTVAFLAFIPIPLYFIYALAKWGKEAFYPTDEWGAREQVQSESLHKGTCNTFQVSFNFSNTQKNLFR